MSILETERLRLREMDLNDVDNLQGIFSDPEAMRYYPGTKDIDETIGWIKWNTDSYRTNGFGLWIATFKDSNEFAGQCGLIVQEVEGSREIEIGYLFLRKHWNKGLATEAARACRDYGIDKGYSRLISLIDPRNVPSCRVAEKMGMSLEKEIIKWAKRVYLYSLKSEKDVAKQ
jgi:RimJ/RimL family protein N-acetyltransferase